MEVTVFVQDSWRQSGEKETFPPSFWYAANTLELKSVNGVGSEEFVGLDGPENVCWTTPRSLMISVGIFAKVECHL